MREIKFRQPLHVGREPTPNTFTKWHYWGFIDGAFIGPETNYDSVEHARRYSEEYINRKDKNGKEIYEGDRVTHPLCIKEPHDENESCETFMGCIKFEADRGQYFAINNKRNGWVIAMSEAYKFEVIGNIYENLELVGSLENRDAK